MIVSKALTAPTTAYTVSRRFLRDLGDVLCKSLVSGSFWSCAPGSGSQCFFVWPGGLAQPTCSTREVLFAREIRFCHQETFVKSFVANSDESTALCG